MDDVDSFVRIDTTGRYGWCGTCPTRPGCDGDTGQHDYEAERGRRLERLSEDERTEDHGDCGYEIRNERNGDRLCVRQHPEVDPDRDGARPNGETDDGGFLTPPPGQEWYAQRERSNAEAFVRDDIPIITREVLDVRRLASTSADIRFSYGAESVPLFRDITAHLSAAKGAVADRVEGVGHAIYFHPASAAAYIQACWV